MVPPQELLELDLGLSAWQDDGCILRVPVEVVVVVYRSLCRQQGSAADASYQTATELSWPTIEARHWGCLMPVVLAAKSSWETET